MSDMYIDVDAAVALIVNKVPLIDDGDFKTREVAIAYNQAGMDLVWNFTTSAGVVTQTAVTPTTAGDYDWTHVGDAVYKIEITASGGASINNDTEGSGFFSGICTGVLAWVSPIYVFRAAGINDLTIDSAFSATRGFTGTALPAAAAEAAGGLPVSDAGGLDLDTKLANTNEITAARMEALTDWINGGRLDLLLDAIKVVTDTQTAITPAALIDLVWDETLTGATHNVPASSGRRLRSVGDATSGTVDDASATTTSFISTLTGAHDDHFADQTLFFTDGTLAGMSRIISTYTASTKEIIFDEALPVPPGDGNGFDINPVHVHTETQIADFVWNEVISKATHDVAGSAAKILRQSGDLIQIDGAVSDASPTTTDFDTNLTQMDTYFADSIMIFTNGAANAGIGKAVSTYVNANGHVTFVSAMAWPVTPVDGDDFVIVALHEHPVSELQAGLATEVNQDNLLLGIIFGSAATGTLSTTQASSDLTGYTNDQLIGRIITVTSGVAEGESSDITDYVETNGVLTFTAMTLAMGNSDTFKIT